MRSKRERMKQSELKKSERTFSPLPRAELLKLPTIITGSASEAAAGGKNATYPVEKDEGDALFKV